MTGNAYAKIDIDKTFGKTTVDNPGLASSSNAAQMLVNRACLQNMHATQFCKMVSLDILTHNPLHGKKVQASKSASHFMIHC